MNPSMIQYCNAFMINGKMNMTNRICSVSLPSVQRNAQSPTHAIHGRSWKMKKTQSFMPRSPMK